MTEIAALIGHGDSGKTTFVCMCSCLKNVEVINAFSYLDETIKEFKIYNNLPDMTPRDEWDFCLIKRKSLFKEWNLSLLDCPGQVQTVVFTDIIHLAKEMAFNGKKNNYSDLYVRLLEKENHEIKNFVGAGLNLSLLEWRDFAIKFQAKYSSFVNDSELFPKLIFVKQLQESEKFIFSINGDWLAHYEENLEAKSALYSQFLDYSYLLSLKEPKKIAVMITKSHLFGLGKNVSSKGSIQKITDDFNKTRETIENLSKSGLSLRQIIDSSRSVKEIEDKFCTFLDAEGSALGLSLNGKKWKTFYVGIPPNMDDPTKHAGREKIFGIQEMMEWLF